MAGPGPAYPYREELHHPALPAPALSRGEMEIASDGALIRRQTAPTVETVEIYRDALRIRTADGARETPIPPELAPLLETLRAVIRKEPLALEGAMLTGRKTGWTLDIPAPQARLSLLGCGDRLVGLELAPAQGARRKILFEPQ